MNSCNCNKCGCSPCRCGIGEPVFSVEAMPDDPTTLRFNVNGKSVWYDFESAIKEGETGTTLTVDTTNRTLDYIGEKAEYTLAASELGSILHLADLADVDADSITDYGILNYRVSDDCPEGCEGSGNGWVSSNPIDVATDSLTYILGSDEDGKLTSLAPPTDTSKFSYLAWAAADGAKYVTPTVVTSIPTDGTYQYPVYMDPSTGELVVLQQEVS